MEFLSNIQIQYLRESLEFSCKASYISQRLRQRIQKFYHLIKLYGQQSLEGIPEKNLIDLKNLSLKENCTFSKRILPKVTVIRINPHLLHPFINSCINSLLSIKSIKVRPICRFFLSCWMFSLSVFFMPIGFEKSNFYYKDCNRPAFV